MILLLSSLALLVMAASGPSSNNANGITPQPVPVIVLTVGELISGLFGIITLIAIPLIIYFLNRKDAKEAKIFKWLEELTKEVASLPGKVSDKMAEKYTTKEEFKQHLEHHHGNEKTG